MNAQEKIVEDLRVDAKPVIIDSNFENIQSQLGKVLEQYDVVVTADTVAESKKQATELNKMAQAIDRRRIDAVKEVSKPIKEFETKAKSLATQCIDARQKILDQVSRFEQKTRDDTWALMEARLHKTYEELGVRDEFQTGSVDDLVNLRSLTGKGSLTSAAARSVEAVAREGHAKQLMIDKRLAELKSACMEAGLEAPLQRSHVESILGLSDEEYAVRLKSMIDVELSRQEQIQKASEAAAEKRAKEAEKDRQRAAAEDLVEKEDQAVDQAAEAQHSDAKPEPMQILIERGPAMEPVLPAAEEVPDGEAYVAHILLTLELTITDGNISTGQVEGQMLKRLADAGVQQSITECVVTKQPLPF